MIRKVVLVAALLVSCSPGAPPSTSSPMTDPAAIANESYGVLESDDSVVVFSRIVDAALSSGLVVALDRSPPHVRVFPRDGGPASAFARSGQGPGEISAPHGVELEGDSVIAVLDGQQVSRYRLSGEWIAQHRLADRQGLMAMALATGCGGDWYFYGRPRDAPRDGTVSWLHRLPLDGSTAHPVDSIRGRGAVRYGALEGIDADSQGAFLWHRTASHHVAWRVPCSGNPERVAVGWAGARAATASGTRPGALGEATVLPDTLFAGAASAADPIWAYTVRELEATVLEAAVGLGCLRARLSGSWQVLDAAQNTILLKGNNPFPRLLVLSRRDVFREHGDCTI